MCALENVGVLSGHQNKDQIYTFISPLIQWSHFGEARQDDLNGAMVT